MFTTITVKNTAYRVPYSTCNSTQSTANLQERTSPIAIRFTYNITSHSLTYSELGAAMHISPGIEVITSPIGCMTL